MCLIVFSYKNHPRYDFLFAANRDEFYGRPTRPAQFWNSEPHLLAGKDMKAGGTWMGVTKSGYFSALTNFRDPDMQKEDPPSRGHLVLEYLRRESGPQQYLEQVDERAKQYNGFNLLAGNMDDLGYYSNLEQDIRLLDPGLYGLSNHLLDTPWPKVERAKSAFKEAIRNDNVEEEALFELLQHDRPAPDVELPDTGISKELERAVSPVFIKTENYGTRSSTVLLIDRHGTVTFEERRFKPGTQLVEDVKRYEFEIEES